MRSVKLDSTRTFLGLDFSLAGAEIQEQVKEKTSRSSSVNRPQPTRGAMNLRGSTIGPLQDIPRTFLILNGRIKQQALILLNCG